MKKTEMVLKYISSEELQDCINDYNQDKRALAVTSLRRLLEPHMGVLSLPTVANIMKELIIESNQQNQ